MGAHIINGFKSGKCSDQFTEETIIIIIYNCLELSHTNLGLDILENVHVAQMTFSVFEQ